MTSIKKLTTDIFKSGGILQQHPRFTNCPHRPRQQEYAEMYAETLDYVPMGKSRLKLAQAETGIGKTLGYMVPLHLKLMEDKFSETPSGYRALISTHTPSWSPDC
jgi:Rad3-related DNA helicase